MREFTVTWCEMVFRWSNLLSASCSSYPLLIFMVLILEPQPSNISYESEVRCMAHGKGMRLGRGESGQSMAEFAIILPLLILLLAASCDVGWVTLHRIRLSEIAGTLAHSNQQEDAAAADTGLLRYIAQNYQELDRTRLTLSVTPQADRETYYEYVWQPNREGGIHYRVPMYYKKLRTKVELSYRLPYLTPWGKLLFGTTDNEITLQVQASAMRILENESHHD